MPGFPLCSAYDFIFTGTDRSKSIQNCCHRNRKKSQARPVHDMAIYRMCLVYSIFLPVVVDLAYPMSARYYPVECACNSFFNSSVFIMTSFVTCVTPLDVIIFCYIQILRKIQKQRKRQLIYLQSQWMDLKNLNGLWKLDKDHRRF